MKSLKMDIGLMGKYFLIMEWEQNKYDGEFISKYFLEIDEKLTIISTNGAE